jgi:hypothetical protein
MLATATSANDPDAPDPYSKRAPHRFAGFG